MSDRNPPEPLTNPQIGDPVPSYQDSRIITTCQTPTSNHDGSSSTDYYVCDYLDTDW
ncbi:MAG: hypothetical protein MI919_36585 [Holophagales bacterium]|nr:hypothetical protein [Holophagales bacterium]